MNATNLFCYRGETKKWTITATQGGSPVVLTGKTVTMTARRNYASPVIFELTSEPDGGITIVNAGGGIAEAQLSTADTSELSNQLTTLVYDVFVDGDLVSWGELEVRPVARAWS
jgi:hypothetical protein